jgi:hypothetical protein
MEIKSGLQVIALAAAAGVIAGAAAVRKSGRHETIPAAFESQEDVAEGDREIRDNRLDQSHRKPDDVPAG